MTLRFYAPVSSGAFAEIIDELTRAGVSCSPASPNLVRCTWRGAHITIVRDDEFVRAQLLDDGGLGVHAWDVIDPILTRMSTTRTGWTERVGVDMACAPPGDTGNVSMFGFQKTCEECGNCDSPGWESFRRWSAVTEHLRDPSTHPTCQPPMYPRPGDAFVFPQNTCEECGNCDSPAWMAFREWSREREEDTMRQIAASERAQERVGGFYYDPDLAKFGNAFSPFVQSDSFERANLALQRPFQDRYNPRYDNQPTWADWMNMGDEWVGASGPQIVGDARGSFESVDKRALFTTAAIAGITTLLALHNKKHWIEIAAAGVGGVALVWGMSGGAKPSTLR